MHARTGRSLDGKKKHEISWNGPICKLREKQRMPRLLYFILRNTQKFGWMNLL